MTMPDPQLHTQPSQVSVTHFGHNCLRSLTAQADSMVLPGVRIGSTNSSSSRSLPSSFFGKVKAYGLLKGMSYPFSVLASGLLQQELQPMAALVGSPSCSGQGRARAAPTAAPSPSHQRSAAMLLQQPCALSEGYELLACMRTPAFSVSACCSSSWAGTRWTVLSDIYENDDWANSLDSIDCNRSPQDLRIPHSQDLLVHQQAELRALRMVIPLAPIPTTQKF